MKDGMMIPPPRETICLSLLNQSIKNENQSKQETGCSDLAVVLDLHAIALVSNPTLKAWHIHHENSNPSQCIHDN